VIRVYDATGNVIEAHEHKGEFKEWRVSTRIASHFSLKTNFHDAAFNG
jgi:hypothetical protein